MAERTVSGYLTSVLDTPVFIDDTKIEHLYDNTVRLIHEHDGRSERLLGEELAERGIREQTSLSSEHLIEEESGHPQRKLFHILQLYDELFPDCVIPFTNYASENLSDSIDCSTSPRQLVHLDLPGKDECGDRRKTKFIPTAAEFESGHIEVLFEQFNAKEDESWETVADKTDVNFVIAIIEEQVEKEGPIRWIDFRLPVSGCGGSIHLHCTPDTKYDVSTFAYNFVKQGFKHGAKVIGTLNRGPDVNVLAVYNK